MRLIPLTGRLGGAVAGALKRASDNPVRSAVQLQVAIGLKGWG